jgi:hypothetical protein
MDIAHDKRMKKANNYVSRRGRYPRPLRERGRGEGYPSSIKFLFMRLLSLYAHSLDNAEAAPSNAAKPRFALFKIFKKILKIAQFL